MLVMPSGVRSAASLWSGARLWTAHFRADPTRRTVVCTWPHAELGIQLLIAVLWDGLDLVLCASDAEFRQLVAEYGAAAWKILSDAAEADDAGGLVAHPSGWPMQSIEPAAGHGADADTPASTFIAGGTRQPSGAWATRLRALAAAPREATGRLELPPPGVVDGDALMRAYLLPLFVADEVWSADIASP